MTDHYLTVQEVAKGLKLSLPTVRNWSDRGESPSTESAAEFGSRVLTAMPSGCRRYRRIGEVAACRPLRTSGARLLPDPLFQIRISEGGLGMRAGNPRRRVSRRMRDVFGK